MPVQTQIQVRRSTAATWTSTNPTLAAGELGFETDTGKFKIGTGSSVWTALSYAGGGSQATFNTFQYTATAAQTTFSGVDANGNTLAYTVGAIQVYLNGALLQNTADYTASNGTSVVLAAGALVGDSLTLIAFGTFTVANTIPASAFTAKGQILVATGSGAYTAQGVGTNGQVLTANSAQADGVEWATPASGGLTLISTTSLSGATVTLSSIPSTYKHLQIVINNAITNSSNLQLRFDTDTTSSWSFILQPINNGGFNGNSANNSGTSYAAIGLVTSASNPGCHFVIEIPNYSDGTSQGFVTCTGITGAGGSFNLGAGVGDKSATLSSITFSLSASTFASGTVYLYGAS